MEPDKDQPLEGSTEEVATSDIEKGSSGTHETEAHTEGDHVAQSVQFTLPPVDATGEFHDTMPSRQECHVSSHGFESQSKRTSYKTKSGGTRGSRRLSSMEMRRLPVDVLLKPIINDNASVLSDEFHAEEKEKEVVGAQKDILHLLCLRPGYTLRTQLLSSFGSISALTILVVVITCIVVAHSAGNSVKDTSARAFENIADETQFLTARYLAEALSQKLLLDNAVNLLHEVTLDRFAGYPSISDDNVPFTDTISGQGKYPIDMAPPPLEWQFEPNVDELNYIEHFRGQEYYRTRPANTGSAGFLMKGVCDPNEVEPEGDAYWPNCTEANNDIRTGGVWEPTDTAESIYNKGKDLIPILKAIFESRDAIRDIGIYFANSGAGASINYPHYPISTQSTYTSTGCEWMDQPNFYDPSKKIGTREMIERCSPAGEVVSSRIYSPIERGWCVDQATNPDSIRYDVDRDAWDNTSWFLTTGRAVYDRITQEFVACIYVGISLALVNDELKSAIVVDGEKIALVQLDGSGTIIGSSFQGNADLTTIYENDIDMTEDDYTRLYTLIDYDEMWEPAEVRERYRDFRVEGLEYLITAYPMPPIPDKYDKQYKPLFVVLVATPISSVYEAVVAASDIVDDRVKAVTSFSIVAGLIGLAIALGIIFMMSDIITKPLRKMNKVASEIVNNFGDPTKENAIGTEAESISREARCAPKTELSGVVHEFNKMVASFSGSSMAKTERHKYQEVYNMFALHRDFAALYNSRANEEFQYNFEKPIVKKDVEKENDDDSISFVNCGTNLMDDHDTFTTSPKKSGGRKKTSLSPLFFWIVALIVIPLLVVNIVITAVALRAVSNEFTESVDEAKEAYLEVEKSRRWVHTRLRADLAAALTRRATNDLHILSRYTNWLFFGGADPSDSFTEMITGVEQCKAYQDSRDCPFLDENDVCDCDWKDIRSRSTCSVYAVDSRFLQDTFWVCQSDSADEKGNRFSNSYPEVSNSKDNTMWWDDQATVPGFLAESGSRYETTWDRLRTASAIPLFQPLYNYHAIKEDTLATNVAFESDGLFLGYDGCSTGLHVTLADFESTVENGAASLRPELCPLGKFGYDPRCRGWYDTGRRLARENNTVLHITAPYKFAVGGGNTIIAQSATSPLVNPETGEHLGQILLDFLPSKMISALNNETPLSSGGFPILIVTENAFEEDTVIGPDYGINDPPTKIQTLVQPDDITCEDEKCKENREIFGETVISMKNGLSGNQTFERTIDGSSQERIHMSFAPVQVESFRPIDSSDFSRGLEVTTKVIYSLGIAETEDGILEGFDPIEKETEDQIRAAIAILSTLLLFATAMVVYVSIRVTESIAEPMVYLLELIRSIRKCDNETAPDLRRVKSSKEVVSLSNSIETLSQVVRSANTAFYAGEFEVAYFVLVDALRLFRRLDNKKAIGIACNNLGNIMMGLYQEMTQEGVAKLAGLTRKQIITKGIAYYHEAIQLGEKAYDEFYALHGWTPICLDFMQHLSNRYFNRGLFLLCTKDDHDKPFEMEKLGKRDLQIASDMDSEVIAYGEDIGWESFDRMAKIFDVKIVRLGGYNLLLLSGFEDIWEVKELMDESFDLIKDEKKRESSGVFERLTCAGRLQEIETELMKYYQAVGDIETAARIAIRSLYEDEKVFVDALARAINVISKYVEHSPDISDSTRSRLSNTLDDYSDMLEDAIKYQATTSMHELESDVITKSAGSGVNKRFSVTAWSMQQSSGRFVTMEDF